MKRRAFTLIELLVVISVIALLIGILLPSLSSARRAAQRTTCATHLRQISQATGSYLADFKDTYYWRFRHPDGTYDIDNYGMDWYVYGGRGSGNSYSGSQPIFNDPTLRPLNAYVNGDVEIFRCPHDTEGQAWSMGSTHFEWVGNSYTFNAAGWPGTIQDPANLKGLAQFRQVDVIAPAQTVMYLDTSLHKSPGSWHGDNGNIALVDGHVVFHKLPDETDANFSWSVAAP